MTVAPITCWFGPQTFLGGFYFGHAGATPNDAANAVVAAQAALNPTVYVRPHRLYGRRT